MEKIILDTDIGCDIDDAICLAYLLAREDCRLLGVTTVNGDTVARAKLASVVVRASGRSVPIYPGSQDTLLLERTRKPVPQADALDRMDSCDSFPRGEYLTFLRDTILAHPGEVTLLAIGPMTNVGLLFAAYPETARALKRLVLMGGNFANPQVGMGYMESNTMCDPHASALVYRAPVVRHCSVGNDVTFQLGMRREQVYGLFPRHPLLSAILPMVDVYFRGGAKALYFHDSCAAASIFRPDMVGYMHGLIEVELRADALMGMTVIKHAAYLSGGHMAASHVDRALFYQDFSEVFGLGMIEEATL